VDEHSLHEMLDEGAVRRVLRMVGSRTDVVVTIGDAAGHLLWASTPGSEGMFGRRPEQFTGHTRFDYVHPDDEAQARRQYARALDGETVRYTIRVRTADERWRRVTSVAWAVGSAAEPLVVTITTFEHDDRAVPPGNDQR
jgi:PAS domain S-box-containing protein